MGGKPRFGSFLVIGLSSVRIMSEMYDSAVQLPTNAAGMSEKVVDFA